MKGPKFLSRLRSEALRTLPVLLYIKLLMLNLHAFIPPEANSSVKQAVVMVVEVGLCWLGREGSGRTSGGWHATMRHTV